MDDSFKLNKESRWQIKIELGKELYDRHTKSSMVLCILQQ